MATEDFSTCRKCGGIMERVSPVDVSPLITECRNCGHQEWAEIQVPPPWSPSQDHAAYARVVIHRGEGQGGAREILALRKLSRELADLPVKEAARKVGITPFFDLGVLPLEEARDLLEKAKGLGLKPTLESPENAESTVLGGTSVAVGEPEGERTVIHFLWIAVGLAVIIGVVIWALL